MIKDEKRMRGEREKGSCKKKISAMKKR